MRFLCLSVLATFAAALSQHSEGATRRDLSSRALKQTTRDEVVRRGSQTRPKRATISPGVPTVGQTFVLQAVAPGTGFNGDYGVDEQSYYIGFHNPTPATASLYSLNQNGNLVRMTDGLFAYSYDDHTFTNGAAVSFVVFETASDAQGFGNRPLICSISGSSEITCYLQGDSTQDQLLVCTGHNSELGIGVPGDDSSYGCTPATFYAFDAM